MLNVEGQSRAIAQLQRSMAARRLAATWTFAGPAGVGKFTLAVELARTVMCDAPLHQPNRGRIQSLPDDFNLLLPCGQCESCRAIDARTHPDLHVLTRELVRIHDQSGKSKATTLSIDVIRGEITGDPAAGKEPKIGKRSFRGKGKFFLIDDADYMNPQAQNALLKSLEEPPPQTYFILITSSPQELLSTIRSRSQIVHFNELPDEIIVPRLLPCAVPNEDARLLARLARGSLGRALAWLDDMRIIDDKNARAANRKARARARAADSDAVDEGEPADQFTPGGILAWTRNLAARLDDLAVGRAAGSDVAAVIARHAAEYSALALARDKLTSADRAKREGIGLMMAIAAEWFTDRMRHGLGTPCRTPLPAQTGALDYRLVPELIASAHSAEVQIDMNANDKILLAATSAHWESLLRQGG